MTAVSLPGSKTEEAGRGVLGVIDVNGSNGCTACGRATMAPASREPRGPRRPGRAFLDSTAFLRKFFDVSFTFSTSERATSAPTCPRDHEPQPPAHARLRASTNRARTPGCEPHPTPALRPPPRSGHRACASVSACLSSARSPAASRPSAASRARAAVPADSSCSSSCAASASACRARALSSLDCAGFGHVTGHVTAPAPPGGDMLRAGRIGRAGGGLSGETQKKYIAKEIYIAKENIYRERNIQIDNKLTTNRNAPCPRSPRHVSPAPPPPPAHPPRRRPRPAPPPPPPPPRRPCRLRRQGGRARHVAGLAPPPAAACTCQPVILKLHLKLLRRRAPQPAGHPGGLDAPCGGHNRKRGKRNCITFL